MTLEMISGPDLGAGFLFQLTVDRTGPTPVLAYHAQEGGIDASGPPKGSPSPFGFRRSTAVCPIGGRDCYHRTFELDEAAIPMARLAYNRFRFVLGPMMEQEYGAAPIPCAGALAEIAGRLAGLPTGSRPEWFLGGSGAAQAQGVKVAPHDIDLGTDPAGVDRIAEALHDYLIEPPSWTEWRPGRRVYAARAFVGTLREGVRVEWAAGGTPVAAAELWTEWDRPPSEIQRRTIDVGNFPVPVSRLEYFVVKRALRGDWPSVESAAQVLRAAGADPVLLEGLLMAAPLSATARERVRRALGPSS